VTEFPLVTHQTIAVSKRLGQQDTIPVVKWEGRNKKMPERTSAIPAWAWIVGAVLVFVGIFAGYRIVQTQQHLAAAQSELESDLLPRGEQARRSGRYGNIAGERDSRGLWLA
jgi:heme/copper-type cytochrome/quinol oxidase subunit 3